MAEVEVSIEALPVYLKDAFQATAESEQELTNGKVKILNIVQISNISSRSTQLAHLLLRRHILTAQLKASGSLHPPTILDRAYTYEALGYFDLAAADAYVTYTLCEKIRNDEFMTDLVPTELDGGEWPTAESADTVLTLLCEALTVLYRALFELGATLDAEEKREELVDRLSELHAMKSKQEIESDLQKNLQNYFCLFRGASSKPESRFGMSRREIYPWNDYEPNRNSPDSVREINDLLSKIAPDLEAKVTVLPALDNTDNTEVWHQLGLFAKKYLIPSQRILQEKSILTAIRPLDDAICDACGADLESIPRENMQQCPGEDCDTTFCSMDCASRAASEYHKPNISSEDEEEEEVSDDVEKEEDQSDEDESLSSGLSPNAPFCGNTELHEIGRTSSTTTPEWDLYFLLLTRTIQISITRNIHPLLLPEIKFLWGDFNPPPQITSTNTNTNNKNQTTPLTTLPFSLYHSIHLPLQYFETLMSLIPAKTKPYTTYYLQNFDWWTIQTLYSKFRGVANAQQSTFDGKPEIAAVHPMWCLANHCCAPNVRWTPTGVREFWVVGNEERVWDEPGDGDGNGNSIEGKKWDGIKAGEEIWSHYTDVRLSVRERRDKLMEVLGGVCRCVRCLREAGN